MIIEFNEKSRRKNINFHFNLQIFFLVHLLLKHKFERMDENQNDLFKIDSSSRFFVVENLQKYFSREEKNDFRIDFVLIQGASQHKMSKD